jgi:predicted Zn-dependent protease
MRLSRAGGKAGNRQVLRRVPKVMQRLLGLVALGPLLAGAQTVYTPENELALGKQLAAEVEQHAQVIADPAITGYVDRIARKVAAGASLRAALTVKVISGTDNYAIILPGGFLDIGTGAIREARNEAELAGVIAHQIGHLMLWPASNPPQPGAVITIPLLFMGPGGLCVRGPAGASGAGLAMPVGYMAASRTTEAKADELGLGYLDTAGYDPGALADFYGRIPKAKAGTASRVFDPGLTMPEATRAQAEEMRNARVFVVNTSEFEDVQRKAAGLAPAQAAVRGDAPSLKK